MPPLKQNTFMVVPNAPRNLLNGGQAESPAELPPSKPPMTTKQARKLYNQQTRGPKRTKAEQRAWERQEQERIRKELEKEAAAAKARAARERKKVKDQAAVDEKKKNGLPLVKVRPSQDTIARFVRRGNKRERASEESIRDEGKENRPPGVESKRPRLSYDGQAEELRKEDRSTSPQAMPAGLSAAKDILLRTGPDLDEDIEMIVEEDVPRNEVAAKATDDTGQPGPVAENPLPAQKGTKEVRKSPSKSPQPPEVILVSQETQEVGKNGPLRPDRDPANQLKKQEPRPEDKPPTGPAGPAAQEAANVSFEDLLPDELLQELALTPPGPRVDSGQHGFAGQTVPQKSQPMPMPSPREVSKQTSQAAKAASGTPKVIDPPVVPTRPVEATEKPRPLQRSPAVTMGPPPPKMHSSAPRPQPLSKSDSPAPRPQLASKSTSPAHRPPPLSKSVCPAPRTQPLAKSDSPAPRPQTLSKLVSPAPRPAVRSMAPPPLPEKRAPSIVPAPPPLQPQPPNSITLPKPATAEQPPPTSTQLFLFDHFDDIMPSPSQEMREIFGDDYKKPSVVMAPPPPRSVLSRQKTLQTPSAVRKPIDGRQLTPYKRGPAPPPFRKPALPTSHAQIASKSARTKEKAPPRPLPSLPAKDTLFAELPLFSTQDISMSTQQLLEEDEPILPKVTRPKGIGPSPFLRHGATNSTSKPDQQTSVQPPKQSVTPAAPLPAPLPRQSQLRRKDVRSVEDLFDSQDKHLAGPSFGRGRARPQTKEPTEAPSPAGPAAKKPTPNKARQKPSEAPQVKDPAAPRGSGESTDSEAPDSQGRPRFFTSSCTNIRMGLARLESIRTFEAEERRREAQRKKREPRAERQRAPEEARKKVVLGASTQADLEKLADLDFDLSEDEREEIRRSGTARAGDWGFLKRKNKKEAMVSATQETDYGELDVGESLAILEGL